MIGKSIKYIRNIEEEKPIIFTDVLRFGGGTGVMKD